MDCSSPGITISSSLFTLKCASNLDNNLDAHSTHRAWSPHLIMLKDAKTHHQFWACCWDTLWSLYLTLKQKLHCLQNSKSTPLHRAQWSEVKWKSLSYVWLFATPWTITRQAPQSMGFSRQEWSGLPFPSPGDLPDQGIESGSPVGIFLLTEPPRKPPGKPRGNRAQRDPQIICQSLRT